MTSGQVLTVDLMERARATLCAQNVPDDGGYWEGFLASDFDNGLLNMFSTLIAPVPIDRFLNVVKSTSSKIRVVEKRPTFNELTSWKAQPLLLSRGI